MQTASPSSQGRGELQVALDDGRRSRTEHAVTARVLLKCSWASHPPSRKKRVEPAWSPHGVYDFCMGGNKRQQNNLIQPAFKEISRPFKHTEILNIVCVLKDSKIKSFLHEDWKVWAHKQSQPSCEDPHGHLLRHFVLVCTCSSHIQKQVTSPYPSLPEQGAHSSESGLDPEHSSLYILPLREHSQPQTALHRPKSANPWRSLVFWFCSGETRASQGTDIIPESVVQTSRQRDAQGLLVIRMSLPMFRLVRAGLQLLVDAAPAAWPWPPPAVPPGHSAKQNQDFKPHSWRTELFQESSWFQD